MNVMHLRNENGGKTLALRLSQRSSVSSVPGGESAAGPGLSSGPAGRSGGVRPAEGENESAHARAITKGENL